MSATIQNEAGRLWQFRIGGVLKKAELDSAQAVARHEIAEGGKIRLLLVLDGFRGWEKGADWGDISFSWANRNQIERIAIVGEREWETPALMFVGAGVRRTEVKFFGPDEMDRARAWLALEPAGREAAELEAGNQPALPDVPEGERPDPWVSRLQKDVKTYLEGGPGSAAATPISRPFQPPEPKE